MVYYRRKYICTKTTYVVFRVSRKERQYSILLKPWVLELGKGVAILENLREVAEPPLEKLLDHLIRMMMATKIICRDVGILGESDLCTVWAAGLTLLRTLVCFPSVTEFSHLFLLFLSLLPFPWQMRPQSSRWMVTSFSPTPCQKTAPTRWDGDGDEK